MVLFQIIFGNGSGNNTRTILHRGVGWRYIAWRWRQRNILALWMYAMWPLRHKMVLFSNTSAARETIFFHTSRAYCSIATFQKKRWLQFHTFQVVVASAAALWCWCYLLSYLGIKVAECNLDNADKCEI